MEKGNRIVFLVGIVAAVAIVFSLIAYYSIPTQATRSPIISTIAIPEGSSLASSETRYMPAAIKVVIGVNNTVSWRNDDSVVNFVEADNDKVDPAFYKATTLPESAITTLSNGGFESRAMDLSGFPNVLKPGQTYEFTFTVPGDYGFHGKPWQRGTVTVLAPGGTS